MVAATFTSLAKRFLKAKEGTTAIMWCAAIVPLLGGTGAALDYMRASQAQTKLQVAMDAAGLAAATSKKMKDKDRLALAANVFKANWQDAATAQLRATPNFRIEGNSVRGDVKLDLDTTLMKVLGFKFMEVNADVQVSFGEGRKAEIALVLDYSGSMKDPPDTGGTSKVEAMREAAIGLVDDLADASPDNVKIGLVPFSHHVWVTLPNRYVVGQGATGNWTGCTQDRPYPYNTKVSTPLYVDDNTKWGQPQAPLHAAAGCDAYAPNGLIVRPLTSDHSGTKLQLENMEPYIWTHIALGFEFGWHLLSSNEPFSQGVPEGDKKTDKIMVLLTDGNQTEPGFGATPANRNDMTSDENGNKGVWDAEDNLEKSCENAKDEGIRVMTIAYDLDDADTVQRLEDCASVNPKTGEKYFYKVNSNADIAKAFDDIKNQVIQMAYLSE